MTRIRIILPFVVLAILCGNAVAIDQKELDGALRGLEKEIAAVRGLAFKSPVVAKIISRPLEKTKKIQGYYSTQEKALFLFDDITGAYERGVLIHEMVHALQDQHFGLSKLHQTSFDSEAELALAALIEGDATYTMIELLKTAQPKVTAMLDAALEKARDIRSAFLYAEGARYVKAVKERGGWPAVNAAYRFPPRTTAAILHPEGVRTVDLGPGKIRGELAVIQMLAGHPETAAIARQAAAGWRGDRFAEHGKGSSWVIALNDSKDAAELHDALSRLKAVEQPDRKSTHRDPACHVWQNADGSLVSVLLRGQRVIAIEAPDQQAHQAILDRLEGLVPLKIYSRDKKELSFGQLIDQLVQTDVICVGEKHDSDQHHRVQLQVLKALFARDERLGVGLEMFQRPFQKEMDRYLKAEISEDEFLANTEYQKRWGFHWSLYQPIVDFCRRNHVPLAALNAPRELTSRISKVGHAGLTKEEKEQLGEIDFQVKEHRDYWYERLAKLHGNTELPKEQKERSYQVMTIWDQFMAASAVQFQKERRLRRMLVLAGSGHIDHGLGIPATILRTSGAKVATISVQFPNDETANAAPPADFVLVITP